MYTSELPIYPILAVLVALSLGALITFRTRQPANLPPLIKGGSYLSGNRKQLARPKPWLLLEEWSKTVGPSASNSLWGLWAF